MNIRLNHLCCLVVSITTLSGCMSGKKDAYLHLSEQTIFEQAQKHRTEENFRKLAEDYEALGAQFPYGRYSEEAQLGLAYAYYKQNDPVQGLVAADRFIRLHPNHPQVDYAYYLKGLIYYNQHLSFLYKYLPVDRSIRDKDVAEKGVQAFALFLKLFPHSSHRADALEKHALLERHTAQYEMNVATYYLEHGAYVSALQRASYVLKRFPQYKDLAIQARTIIEHSEKKLKIDHQLSSK